MGATATESIRAVALVGHAGSGKTLLTEALLHASGAIATPGTIERGSTVSDFDLLEKQHQHSLYSSPVFFDRDGVRIHVIDTPGLSDFLSRGFDVLGAEFIKTGQLDRLLLRPRTMTLQLIGNDMRLSRFGRTVQGLVVLWIATASLRFHWTALKIVLALWTIAGGVALFFGLIVIQGAISFWTVEEWMEAVEQFYVVRCCHKLRIRLR